MKALLNALFDDEAQAEIDEARFQATKEAKDAAARQEDADEEDDADPVDQEKVMDAAVLRAVGPIVERLTKNVAKSFGFEGGFEQALASIQDAQKRKDDEELNVGFSKIVELFYPIGGRIPSLHDVVQGFANAGADEQEAAMLDLQHRIAGAKGSERGSLEAYAAAMKGIRAKGISYVKITLHNLVRQARARQAAGESNRHEDKAAFDLQFDVLTHFLSPEGEKDLDDSLSELQPNSEL
jgi:hypothetical protein